MKKEMNSTLNDTGRPQKLDKRWVSELKMAQKNSSDEPFFKRPKVRLEVKIPLTVENIHRISLEDRR